MTGIIRLYETNSDVLVIEREDENGVSEAWSLVVSGDFMESMFLKDAYVWLLHEWQPSESDGLDRAEIDEGTSLVATWSQEGGIQFIKRPHDIHGAAKSYIGEALNG